MRTDNLTENEVQIYEELDESKAKIESLETAVKQKTVINDSILELIYTNSKRIDEVEKKLDAILKEMKTFNETNAH